MPADRRLALGQRLDVNRAPLADLVEVPGVGPRLAARLVDGRPYEAIEALDRVRGVGPKTLAALSRFLTVGPTTVASAGRSGRGD